MVYGEDRPARGQMLHTHTCPRLGLWRARWSRSSAGSRVVCTPPLSVLACPCTVLRRNLPLCNATELGTHASQASRTAGCAQPGPDPAPRDCRWRHAQRRAGVGRGVWRREVTRELRTHESGLARGVDTRQRMRTRWRTFAIFFLERAKEREVHVNYRMQEKCSLHRHLTCVNRHVRHRLRHTAHATWDQVYMGHQAPTEVERCMENKSVTRNGPQPFARRATSHRRCLVLRTPLRSRLAASARPLVPLRSDAALSLPSLRRNWRQICGGSRGDAAPLLPRRLTARCSRGTCRRVAAAARRRGRRASS